MSRALMPHRPAAAAAFAASTASLPVPAPAGAPAAAVALLLALALAGCATPAAWAPPPPDQALVQADVPARLPAAAGSSADTPALQWRDVVRAPRLVEWVTLALAHNRDLRVAAANVQRAQAQFRSTDASRLPTLGAGLNASRAPNSQGDQANALSAGVQLASWEIDLFGRLANLSEAALAQTLSAAQTQRATELAVVAAVLQAGLALQADDELLQLARQTLASREQTLRLVRLREAAGASSQLDLQAQAALVAQAGATLAQLERQRAQDGNALALLLGRPVPDAAAAAGPALADEAWLTEVPAGLSSAVLLRRPDVMQAEAAMRAADANIGAARAAFLPSISLTGQAGQASPQLSGLFQGGNFAYTLAANLALTVFDGGRRQANLDSCPGQPRGRAGAVRAGHPGRLPRDGRRPGRQRHLACPACSTGGAARRRPRNRAPDQPARRTGRGQHAGTAGGPAQPVCRRAGGAADPPGRAEQPRGAVQGAGRLSCGARDGARRRGPRPGCRVHRPAAAFSGRPARAAGRCRRRPAQTAAHSSG